MLNEPRISACIVLYHSGEEVMDAVRCIQASTVPVTLYLADNSPQDPTATKIQKQWPNVTVLPQKGNIGFGAANNAVLPLLKSQYHLICNPDITFEPDLLARMTAYMDAHRDIVILTPRVMNLDGTEQFLPKRRPTVRYLLGGKRALRGEAVLAEAAVAAEQAAQLQEIAHDAWRMVDQTGSDEETAGLPRGAQWKVRLHRMADARKADRVYLSADRKARRLTRRGSRLTAWRREYTLADQNITTPMEVQFATGCFLLIRTQAFYSLGGFDQRFFLYQEDSDLTLRALRLGKVVYHPDMCVTHAWKRDSQHSRRQTAIHILSTVKFFRKWGLKW